MKKLFAVVSLAVLALGGAAAQAGDKITIATEGAYKPFNFVADDGSLQGFDVDIAKALCAKMQADCVIVKQDWDGMIPGLLAKKFDAVVASMAITDERKQKIDFSRKYYNTPAVIVARKDMQMETEANGNPTPAALKGLKIGLQRSTVYENYARAHFPGAEIVVYDSADNANLDLFNGRLDARLDDILALKDGVLTADGGADYKIFGQGYVGDELGEGIGVGLRKEDTRLRDAFSKAIEEIRADGTYKKINDKYFDFDVYGAPAS